MSLLPIILCALLLLAVALVELRATYADALESGTPSWPRVPGAMIMAILGAGIAEAMERYGLRPPDWELWTIAGLGALVVADKAMEQAQRERHIEDAGQVSDELAARLHRTINQSGRGPQERK